MKTFSRLPRFAWLLPAFLLLAAGPCLAKLAFVQVTKEKATELGIEVRTKPDGANAIRVEVEFKAEGPLKSPTVKLKAGKGTSARAIKLKNENKEPGGVVVYRFSADLAKLEDLDFEINAWVEEAGTIYRLRLNDFIVPKAAAAVPKTEDEIKIIVRDYALARRGKVVGVSKTKEGWFAVVASLPEKPGGHSGLKISSEGVIVDFVPGR